MLHSNSPPSVAQGPVRQQPAGTLSSRFAFAITVPHASGDVPHWLGQVAASPEWLDRAAGTHHALDRGAAVLARAVGARLAAPVFEGEFSRLFLDLNRPLDDPSAIAAEIEGWALEFNAGLAAGDLASRRMAHRRGHQRIDDVLLAAAVPTFLVDQHSFDRFGPAPDARGVDVGVCAPVDDDFARALLDNLLKRTRERGGNARPKPEARLLNIRLNQPYSANHPGAYIMRRHMMAAAGGVVVEVCDDLLTGEADVAAIADLLSDALTETAGALVPSEFVTPLAESGRS